MNCSRQPEALFLSPHLDDAAFSCAEPMLALRESGWQVTLATVFTASVETPTGFALACQLDKGLSASTDYMALRRAEDEVFAQQLGIACRHLNLPEAPHRGYGDVAALFGPLRDDDPVRRQTAEVLRASVGEIVPDVLFAPLAIGGHVDHRAVVDALRTLKVRWRDGPQPAIARHADQPYALRHPGEVETAVRSLLGSRSVRFASEPQRRRRAIAAIGAYTTQITFQFGSVAAMHDTLDAAFGGGTDLWLEGSTDESLDHHLCHSAGVA